jgi:hypothetical protein
MGERDESRDHPSTKRRQRNVPSLVSPPAPSGAGSHQGWMSFKWPQGVWVAAGGESAKPG